MHSLEAGEQVKATQNLPRTFLKGPQGRGMPEEGCRHPTPTFPRGADLRGGAPRDGEEADSTVPTIQWLMCALPQSVHGNMVVMGGRPTVYLGHHMLFPCRISEPTLCLFYSQF